MDFVGLLCVEATMTGARQLPILACGQPHLRVLQQRGLEHERAYIASLRAKGLSVLDLSGEVDAYSTP